MDNQASNQATNEEIQVYCTACPFGPYYFYLQMEKILSEMGIPSPTKAKFKAEKVLMCDCLLYALADTCYWVTSLSTYYIN